MPRFNSAFRQARQVVEPGASAGLVQQVSPLIAAAAAAGLALLVVFGVTQDILRPALGSLAGNRGQIGLTGTLSLVLVITGPIGVGALAYFTAWQLTRLLELGQYLRRVHGQMDRTLKRQAPLLQLGFTGTAAPFVSEGDLQAGAETSLAVILPRARNILLLGDDGSGKTTILRQYARDLSRLRYLLPIALGRASLPLLVPLAAYAAAPAESGGPRTAFLADQLRAWGGPSLAARLPLALQRWNIAILCDGLDEVPEPMRPQVAAELAPLATEAYPSVRVVITCALQRYLAESAQLEALDTFQRAIVPGLGPQSVQRVLRQAQRALHLPGEPPDALVASANGSGLGAERGHPATLAALLALRAANVPIPSGRGRLLREYAELLCRSAAGQGIESKQLSDLLRCLANTLRRLDTAYIPIPRRAPRGQVVHQWLTTIQTLSPQASYNPPPLPFGPAQLDQMVAAALRVGILEEEVAGAGVRFAQRALEAVFAAISLEDSDDGASPLSHALLHPAWLEPLLLWSGFTSRPGNIALRLLHMAGVQSTGAPRTRPLSASPYARSPSQESLLALALAAMLEAHAPAIARTASPVSAGSRIALASEQLRDTFEQIERSLQLPAQRIRFADALVALERACAIDIGGHLATIAQASVLGRLVRAQAASLLGLSASPTAADGLVALLAETDPVMCQAVDHACTTAGPEMLTRLRQELSSGDERIRARATTALSQGGPAALEMALAGLRGTDPRQRAAAARVLGALGAGSASETLAASLDDPDPGVRAAAAWALGQLGSESAIAQLETHLTQADPQLKMALAIALGATRRTRAFAPLMALLADPDARVRAAAADALGKLGDERAIRALRDHLSDPDPWAQTAAATSLRRLGSR